MLFLGVLELSFRFLGLLFGSEDFLVLRFAFAAGDNQRHKQDHVDDQENDQNSEKLSFVPIINIFVLVVLYSCLNLEIIEDFDGIF